MMIVTDPTEVIWIVPPGIRDREAGHSKIFPANSDFLDYGKHDERNELGIEAVRHR